MTRITTSAPGKLLLMGEHAVVYGRPGIVTAVDQRMKATVEEIEEKELVLGAPDVQVTNYRKPLAELGKGDVPKGAKFVEIAVRNFLGKYRLKTGIKVTTSSDFSSQFGFGSSSASIVCVLKALFELNGIPKPTDANALAGRQVRDDDTLKRQLFDLSYQTVLDVQGKGSGFDVAAAIWGGTQYFVTGGKIIEPLSLKTMPIVVGYTGIKADTVSIVSNVAEKFKFQQEKVEKIYDAIAKLVDEARTRIREGDWERVGKLMDFNQEYLRDLGVSSTKLEQLISSVKKAGAWGAKLSGAGGGDCMIALVSPDKRTAAEKAITDARGTVMRVALNAPGVRAETTDNQKELFIVVDKDDNVIGFKTRYECHHDKTLIHRTVGVLVYDQAGKVLLQKRSITKDMEPGLWGLSAAGHVAKGQSYEEAARRELTEELGIEALLEPVGKHIVRSDGETEMSMLYRCVYTGPFRINTEEIDRVDYFDPRSLAFSIASKKIRITQHCLQSLRDAKILGS